MTQPCATVIGVRILDGYRIESRFSDGAEGVVDLPRRIVGRGGAIVDSRLIGQESGMVIPGGTVPIFVSAKMGLSLLTQELPS